jgi:hypothetical protein
MNKQRKAKLYDRSLAYSNANQDRGADSLSFEDGYRAAMRDMRKVLAERAWGYTQQPAAVKRTILIDAIKQFLLPLR